MKIYECKHCGLSSETSVCPSCGKRAELKRSEVYYCTHCKTIVFTPTCNLCKNDAILVGSDCRPVFPHERALLEILTDSPKAYMNASMWNMGANNYLVDGKKVRFSYTELQKRYERNYILSALKEYRAEIEKYENAFYDTEPIKNFVKANEVYLNRLVYEATEYVKDVKKGYDLDEMFVSFSGGKDSTVVSDIVKRAIGENVIHIYGDTTLEFDTTNTYIHTYIHTYKHTPFLIAKNKEQDFCTLCEKIGPPSRMLRWCCTVFKTGSISKKIENTFLGKKQILSFQGIRRLESKSRDKYERISNDSKVGKQIAILPILDWADCDVWLYIISTKIPFNDAYRLGYSRVGCYCCPNNSSWSEFLSSLYMKERYDKFQSVLYDFATATGKHDVEDYVKNGEWKKRQGGNGLKNAKNTIVEYRPCVFEANSFNFVLSHPIDDFLYTLFLPFGNIDKNIYSKNESEVYILSRVNSLPLLKLQGEKGTSNLKVSILNRIGDFKDIKKAEQYIKYQINKFQLCVGCTGCSQVCRHNALSVHLNEYGELLYKINPNKCLGCLECVTHFQGGCFMNKCLKIRKDTFKGEKNESKK